MEKWVALEGLEGLKDQVPENLSRMEMPYSLERDWHAELGPEVGPKVGEHSQNQHCLPQNCLEKVGVYCWQDAALVGWVAAV